MTNSKALANLAFETWKASGDHTYERATALVEFFATSYFGPAPRPRELAEMIGSAKLIATDKVRSLVTR